MKFYIVALLGHFALTLASESASESATPTESSTIANCTKPDKATIQKKVTVAMQKTVEQLFSDASFFRKRRLAAVLQGGSETNGNQRADLRDDQVLTFIDSVVPVELEREHQRVDPGTKPDSISKRSSNYQYISSSNNIAYANAILKKDQSADLTVQKATAKGGDFAYAGSTLSRSKRFCVPLSYDDGVKNMVKRVVDQAFKTLEF